MGKVKEFMKKKDIEISLKRYGIDALGAMAQGLFCSLLIGTIIDTVGQQFGISFLTQPVGEKLQYTVGDLAKAMSGPAMAVAIGYALKCPPLVLFSLIIFYDEFLLNHRCFKPSGMASAFTVRVLRLLQFSKA